MDQSLQEDDHGMPSNEENQSSVELLLRNGSENTINDCFVKIKNGIMSQTPFHEHAKVINLKDKFVQGKFLTKMFFCNFCKEHWFEKKSRRINIAECTDGKKARKDPSIYYRKLAEENNMDPYRDRFPHHLPKLSKIKEILIAYVYPVMKTYWLKGGTIGHKGDVLNIEQDIDGNPLYADINIDFDLLSQLPKGSSVEGEVNVVGEEELGQDAQNISTAAREMNVSPIQAIIGPEQGGTSCHVLGRTERPVRQ
eukprot:13149728-Ditylum_brightwellii.AAC.1